MLNDEVPLIGFAGSPWTIMCYAVEGKGSKSFDMAKVFVSNIQKQHMFYCKKIRYYNCIPQRKVKAGVNAVQIFDSWGGMFVSSGLSILMEIHQPNYRSVGRCNTRNCFGKGCWLL
jgi:uroporphyrinogen decarboxylase